MDLQDAKALAELHMEKHGLLQQRWVFRFSQEKTFFGRCHHRLKIIRLSQPLTELNDELHVENTILHEIAHALAGPKHNHDSHWKRLAMSIGCTGTRCYDTSVVQPKGRWQMVCDACGRTIQRYSKTETVRSCGTCSPRRFNPAFILRWERNS